MIISQLEYFSAFMCHQIVCQESALEPVTDAGKNESGPGEKKKREVSACRMQRYGKSWT